MSSETVKALEVVDERDALLARLADLEQGYDDLLQRVRRYERERAEIRARLEGLLKRIGPPPGLPRR